MKNFFIILLGIISLAAHSSDFRCLKVDDSKKGALTDASLMTMSKWSEAFVITGDVDSVIAMLREGKPKFSPHDDFNDIKAILLKEGRAIQFSVDTVFDKRPVKINFTLHMVLDQEPQRINISDLTITKSEDDNATPVALLVLHKPNAPHSTVKKINLAPCVDRSVIVYPLFDADNPAASYNIDGTTKFINVFNLATAAYAKTSQTMHEKNGSLEK